jgi:hypothetical protein
LARPAHKEQQERKGHQVCRALAQWESPVHKELSVPPVLLVLRVQLGWPELLVLPERLGHRVRQE